MGLRYRKSINLGGGFRINLSRSGIGYSWGVKGYRITKTAKGSVRKTVSIPCTGISYVSESSGKHNQPSPQNVPPAQPYHPQTLPSQTYENANAEDISSAAVSDILTAAKRSAALNNIAIGCLIALLVMSCVNPLFLIGAFASLALEIVVRTKGTVALEYDISDDDSLALWNARMGMLSAISQSSQLWRMMESASVVDQKRNAGAQSLVKRTPCTVSYKLPFPFQSNINCVSFSSGKEKLIFLPDMLLIKQGKMFGALTYNDFDCRIDSTSFIEAGNVPKDAAVIGQT